MQAKTDDMAKAAGNLGLRLSKKKTTHEDERHKRRRH